MKNDSKLRLILHPIKGLKMETNATPFLQKCVGLSIVIAVFLWGAASIIEAAAPNGLM